jgi:hypothetical protein
LKRFLARGGINRNRSYAAPLLASLSAPLPPERPKTALLQIHDLLTYRGAKALPFAARARYKENQ